MSLMGDADNERARAERLPEGSVIAVLLAQHARIRNQFAAVQVAPPSHRREPFDRLREMIAAHEIGEEIVVRPLSRKSAGAQIADARDQEEEDAAQALAELEGIDPSSEQFATKLAELAEAVSAHAEREETEELPALQAAHTDEELQALGARLLEAERAESDRSDPTAGSADTQRLVEPYSSLLDKARDAFSA